MSARVTWDGLDELRRALRSLPKELADEAGDIVLHAAERAQRAIVYPRRTGDLADHLQLQVQSGGPFGARVVVKNTAKHAHLFEDGTQARHTKLGLNRGTMPAGNVFVPAVVRSRRQMYDELKAMLRAHGLVVTGDA